MGRYLTFHWDQRERTSRPVRLSDLLTERFQAFVPHKLAGWVPSLTHQETVKAIESAHWHIARLRENPSRMPATDMHWLLDRAESLASSTIEGIHPSARRVARAEAQMSLFGENPPEAERQALCNVELTRAAVELGSRPGPLTNDDLLGLHAILMADDERIAGKYRERFVWIGGKDSTGPVEADHVGPPADLVPDLMGDLLGYVNNDDGDPLVRAAVAHAQFEVIHPFADGNGRTGRALIAYLYRRDGLALEGVLPVSSSLARQRETYYSALDATHLACAPDALDRSNSVDSWIRMCAEATSNACDLSDRLSGHLAQLKQKWEQQARAAGIRSSSTARRLLAQLPQQPTFTAESAAESIGVSTRSAQRAVNSLAKAGLIVQRSAGKRNRIFESADMMDAFTEAIRTQPVSNLDLGTPSPSPEQDLTERLRNAKKPDGNPTICGAPRERGGFCRHPRPHPQGRCPAGHRPRG